jgi:NADH-quinone oxidoreductase subunit N
MTATFDASDLLGILPAFILSCGALVLLTSEVFLRSEAPDRRYQAWLSAGFSAAALWAAVSQAGAHAQPIFGGAAVSDPFAGLVAAIVCGSLLLSCLVAAGYLEALKATRGEFYALALFSAAGMCLLSQATDLIVVFIALEVMSLAVYCLTAYLRRGKRPAEAAFKYFVLGSFASAIFLYGAALAFGATGSTRIADLAAAVRAAPGGSASPLLYASAALLAAGFAFKVAAVPFHMWVPDVYDGAPAPVTGFMAAGVKAAAFATLVRILVSGYGDAASATGAHGWQQLLVWLSLATMVIGNLLAIPQRSVKRMLAYSSIAHAGYLLAAVAAMGAQGPRGGALNGLIFYLVSYAATVIGAFGVVALLERKLALAGLPDDLSSWAGLSEKHPLLSAAMALFMISLAGIPPTAGFMAKLAVFRSAIDAGLYPLAIGGVLTSAAGLYYYLGVVVQMYMKPVAKPDAVVGRTAIAGVAVACAALLVLWLGVMPGSFSSMAAGAAGSFGATAR